MLTKKSKDDLSTSSRTHDSLVPHTLTETMGLKDESIFSDFDGFADRLSYANALMKDTSGHDKKLAKLLSNLSKANDNNRTPAKEELIEYVTGKSLKEITKKGWEQANFASRILATEAMEKARDEKKQKRNMDLLENVGISAIRNVFDQGMGIVADVIPVVGSGLNAGYTFLTNKFFDKKSTEMSKLHAAISTLPYGGAEIMEEAIGELEEEYEKLIDEYKKAGYDPEKVTANMEKFVVSKMMEIISNAKKNLTNKPVDTTWKAGKTVAKGLFNKYSKGFTGVGRTAYKLLKNNQKEEEEEERKYYDTEGQKLGFANSREEYHKKEELKKKNEWRYPEEGSEFLGDDAGDGEQDLWDGKVVKTKGKDLEYQMESKNYTLNDEERQRYYKDLNEQKLEGYLPNLASMVNYNQPEDGLKYRKINNRIGLVKTKEKDATQMEREHPGERYIIPVTKLSTLKKHFPK